MKDSNGATISKDDKADLQKTFYTPINGHGKNKDDWLEIADHINDVWITLRNEKTGPEKEVYYHLEISKESDLWKHLVKIIKECDQSTSEQ